MPRQASYVLHSLMKKTTNILLTGQLISNLLSYYSRGHRCSSMAIILSNTIQDVTSDSLRIRTKSSTLNFMNSSVSLAGIVLITSSPIKRVSIGFMVAKNGMDGVYAGCEGGYFLAAHRQAGSWFDNQSYNGDLHRPHNSRTVVADTKNRMEVGHHYSSDCNKDPDHRRACSLLGNHYYNVDLYKTHNSRTVVSDSENRIETDSSPDPTLLRKTLSNQLKDLHNTAATKWLYEDTSEN
ncbi:hypothetical protein Tco_0047658 [Tanacetum coccineum]